MYTRACDLVAQTEPCSEWWQIKSFGVQKRKRSLLDGVLEKASWRRWHSNIALEMGSWDQGAGWRAWLEQKQRRVVGKAGLQRAATWLPWAPRASHWHCSAMLTLPLYLCLQGIINLGTGENKLCFDLLSKRVSPSVPLGGISCKGLSFLKARTLPTWEPATCLGSPGLPQVPGLPWGQLSLWPCASHFSTLILLPHFIRLLSSRSPSCLLGSRSQRETSVLYGQYLTTGCRREGTLVCHFCQFP